MGGAKVWSYGAAGEGAKSGTKAWQGRVQSLEPRRGRGGCKIWSHDVCGNKLQHTMVR